MSRIGNLPVEIPGGVSVKLAGSTLAVKGPKGDLSFTYDPRYVTVSEGDGNVSVARGGDDKTSKAMHGTTQRLIAQMVEGVTKGFEKSLEIQGTGYRAETQGRKLVAKLGHSHDIHFDPPEGITIQCPEPTKIVVSGVDKQKVGQVAAVIRSFRPPEPYKGKGVRYVGEYVRRKQGKAAK